MSVPLCEILEEMLPAPEGEGSEEDVVSSPRPTYFNKVVPHHETAREKMVVGNNKTPRTRRLVHYRHPAELITLDEEDDEDTTTGECSDGPVMPHALRHHLPPTHHSNHLNSCGIASNGGLPHVTYHGMSTHKRVLPMLSVTSTMTGSDSVFESPRNNSSQHRVVAQRVSSSMHHQQQQHVAAAAQSSNDSFCPGNCSTSTSACKDESFATPHHRHEDDVTTFDSYGSPEKSIGLGPHVVKTLAEAYEVVCRDLGPIGGGGGGAAIAFLQRTPVAGPLGCQPPPPVHGLLSVHPTHSTASSTVGMDPSDAAGMISEELAALSHERLTAHCTELHLILLRLLELSRSQKHTALAAMRSMASLSPQAVAPVQTTHTVNKQVDADGSKSINGYTMLHELGRGSCAKVKLAFDSRNSRMVAIKIVRRVDLKVKLGGQTQAQAQFQSLQREIAVMKKLRHKNVVSLYEVIDDPEAEKLYLVMQYIDNGPMTTIASGTASCTPIPPTQLLVYARHIFAGLMYLHQRSIVHRDIKLENILVSKDGVAYLADFGVSEVFGLTSARQASRTKHPRQSTVEGQKGTVLYMAPELLHNGLATNGSAVDIWAAGVTLYAALTGKLPFASVGDIIQARATLVIPKEYGKHWERLLRSVLAIRPEDRFTAMEAHTEVKRMLRSEELKRRHRQTEASAAAVNQPTDPLGGVAIQVEDNDIDCAFTPVFTTVQQQNSMLQEGRFSAADLLGTSSSCSSEDGAQHRHHHADDASSDNDDGKSTGRLYTVPTPPPTGAFTNDGATAARRLHTLPLLGRYDEHQPTEEAQSHRLSPQGFSREPSPEVSPSQQSGVRVPHRPVGS